MDIGRSFTYITEDQDWWKKVLLAGLISLIPIVGQLYILGYVLETLKNVIAGREVPLPEIGGDFGGKLIKGLLLWVITFVYFLPLTLLGACSGVGSSVFPTVIEDIDAAEIVTAVWAGCFGCLSILVGLVANLFLPFAWSRYAETGSFGDALQLGKIFEMLKNNIGQTVIVLLVMWLAGLAAMIVGSILCGVGLIFTFVYAQLITAFLYGTLYRRAQATVL